MFSAKTEKLITYLAMLAGLLMLLVLAGYTATLAQGDPAYLRFVRHVPTGKFGMTHPGAVSFSPKANAFLVVQASGAAQPQPGATTIALFTQRAEPAGSVEVPFAFSDAINTAFDSKANRLLVWDTPRQELIAIQALPTGVPDPTAITRFQAREFGVPNPRGLAVDPNSGQLYLLDDSGKRLVRITPGADGSFDGAAAQREGRISEIDLKSLGLGNVRGLAFNPTNGHLYLINPAKQTLYELTGDGQLVTTRDFSKSRGFKLVDSQGLAFAPSGDQTDDPAQMSLYVADSRQGDQWQRDGQITELSLTQPAVVSLPAAVTGDLVHTINAYQWSTPSTDSMGIGYLPASNHLLVTDAEIEEPPQNYWHGVNLFETTLSGTLVKTYTTYTSGSTSLTPNNFSDEPTEFSYNPLNGKWYFSDDDALRVFEVTLGSDGAYGTSDDIVRAFSTASCGGVDSEGVAVNTWNGHLLVVDGINSEIYDIGSGANGIFDGCPPAGDDVVTHFDTSSLGVSDPEGIEFNSDTGTLYFVGGTSNVVEATTAGTVVQVINISTANSYASSGIARAPGSTNPGVKNLYITDRGIDNGTNPNENDGKIYEISLGQSAGTPTNTPTATSGPSLTPTNTPTPTPTATPRPDTIFADSFETGNLAAWTSSSTNGGALSAAPAAALRGAYGLQAAINSNTSIFVRDDTPNAEPRYRARFYYDPNSIVMASGNAHYLLYGYSGASTVVLRVELRYNLGYQVRAALVNNSSTWTTSSWFALSDAPHVIEVDWRASTAAGANNGGLTMWLDGVQSANLTGVANDTRRIDRVQLGAVAGIDSGTRGTEYFDAFESRRQTYIGPVSDNPTPTPTNTPTNTATATPTSTATPTPTATPTNTPTPTITPTNTPTNTPTATPTETPTNTPTATSGPSPTPTNTATVTNTPTPTNTSTPTATATVPPPGFPVSGALDSFNRSDGSIGANWGGSAAGYSILGNGLLTGSGGDIYWNQTSYGANQEAFVTLTSIDLTSTEISLSLKAQSSSSRAGGLIQVWYKPSGAQIRVYTYDAAQGWVKRGVTLAATFVNGDQLGARATADGSVYVYRNGALLGIWSVTGWPNYASGGYIGLWVISPNASVLDDFGGGTVD